MYVRWGARRQEDASQREFTFTFTFTFTFMVAFMVMVASGRSVSR